MQLEIKKNSSKHMQNPQLMSLKLRPYGGLITFFFTKINFGFYIKALSTNFNPVFTELRDLV